MPSRLLVIVERIKPACWPGNSCAASGAGVLLAGNAWGNEEPTVSIEISSPRE